MSDALTNEQLEAIKHDYSKEGEDRQVLQLIKDLADERHDVELLSRSIAEVYDEISGGQISKPLTDPKHLIEWVNELQERAVREAMQHVIALIRDDFDIDLDDILPLKEIGAEEKTPQRVRDNSKDEQLYAMHEDI